MPLTSLPRLLITSAIALGLSGLCVSNASAAAVQDRIATAASTGGFVAIPNSVQPRARGASDLGPMRGDARLQGVSIHFNMSTAQEAALDQLLADQQNPASPRYHQWLTPEQYGDQFGLSTSDLGKVTAWLESQGLTITGVANGKTSITFDGTVAQVQAAFATSIHSLSLNGETHFANITNISVPSQFSGVVSGVTGLHDFRLQPRIHPSVAKPEFTSSISAGHFTAPGDLYAVYNMEPLLSAGINGSGVGTGANCHSVPTGSPCGDIAVVGQVDINSADVLAFRTAAGLSTTNLPTTLHAAGVDPGPPVCTSCTTGPSQGDLNESSVDVEWAGAMAPGANIVFVNAKLVIPDAISWAINQNVAPIVTSSYGLCEAGWGSSELLVLNALFKQGNAQGQTIMAASADNGATDCDTGPTATEGLQVDFPGSSPYVTSMGGTMFNDGNATGATTYWLGTDATFTAGTAVPAATYSATGYIPEAAWNDASLGAFGGGGGGASAFFTKPAWQLLGTPADAARDVPDLSLDGADGHDPLLFCVNVVSQGICTNGFRYASGANINDLNFEGGTSFDSQIFGGMLALVEQKIGSRIGNANPTIYALGNSKYYAPGQTTATNATVVFNDVTNGNNAMPCTAGSPNCGSGGTAGYNAVNGYDLATGWGSVNLTNLANDWALVTPLGFGTLGPSTSSTSLSASPTTASAGATVTLTATVTGSAGEPTGTVTFLANNVALASPVPLPSNGVATYSWVTSCSALGQQVMSASYSGDSTYQGSIGPALTLNGSTTTSPVEVQVSSTTCPDFGLTPSSAGTTASGNNLTITVAAGGTIPAVTITATPTNNFTGTVVFSSTTSIASGDSGGYVPTLTFSPQSVAITSSSAVTTTLTLSGITADLHLPEGPGRGSPAHPDASRTPWYAAGSGVTIASLLMLVLPRRRRLAGLLMVVMAVAFAGGLSGCGSSQAVVGSSPTSSTNPYAGTYTVTVVGTYTNTTTGMVTQHVANLTYQVY